MYLGNPQFDRSLLTVDINGAQPKNKHAYMNRLLPNQLRFEDHLRMQVQVQPQDFKFGRRRYQHDFHHFCNLVVPQGELHFEKTQKKHYLRDEGEIKQFHALENHFDLPQYYHIPNEDNQWLIECQLQMISMVQSQVLWLVKPFETKKLPKEQDFNNRK